MIMRIHSHVLVGTRLRRYPWDQNKIWFVATVYLPCGLQCGTRICPVVNNTLLDSLQWPIVLKQIIRSSPQCKRRLWPMAHSLEWPYKSNHIMNQETIDGFDSWKKPEYRSLVRLSLKSRLYWWKIYLLTAATRGPQRYLIIDNITALHVIVVVIFYEQSLSGAIMVTKFKQRRSNSFSPRSKSVMR